LELEAYIRVVDTVEQQLRKPSLFIWLQLQTYDTVYSIQFFKPVYESQIAILYAGDVPVKSVVNIPCIFYHDLIKDIVLFVMTSKVMHNIWSKPEYPKI
jgi:hypothetical protein